MGEDGLSRRLFRAQCSAIFYLWHTNPEIVVARVHLIGGPNGGTGCCPIPQRPERGDVSGRGDG